MGVCGVSVDIVAYVRCTCVRKPGFRREFVKFERLLAQKRQLDLCARENVGVRTYVHVCACVSVQTSLFKCHKAVEYNSSPSKQ